MDLPWGDERSVMFITNVGLVTTTGPHGTNIMACEGTHHLSYGPGLVAVNVGNHKATGDNIRATKEFGVSIAATDQTVLASVAGGSHGNDHNKIAILKELGFQFIPSNHIEAPLVKDAALLIECKLIAEVPVGDHTLFVGEVLSAVKTAGKEPLGYHQGRYWKMAEPLPKPSEAERAHIKQIVEKHKKSLL